MLFVIGWVVWNGALAYCRLVSLLVRLCCCVVWRVHVCYVRGMSALLDATSSSPKSSKTSPRLSGKAVTNGGEGSSSRRSRRAIRSSSREPVSPPRFPEGGFKFGAFSACYEAIDALRQRPALKDVDDEELLAMLTTVIRGGVSLASMAVQLPPSCLRSPPQRRSASAALPTMRWPEEKERPLANDDTILVTGSVIDEQMDVAVSGESSPMGTSNASTASSMDKVEASLRRITDICDTSMRQHNEGALQKPDTAILKHSTPAKETVVVKGEILSPPQTSDTVVSPKKSIIDTEKSGTVAEKLTTALEDLFEDSDGPPVKRMREESPQKRESRKAKKAKKEVVDMNEYLEDEEAKEKKEMEERKRVEEEEKKRKEEEKKRKEEEEEERRLKEEQKKNEEEEEREREKERKRKEEEEKEEQERARLKKEKEEEERRLKDNRDEEDSRRSTKARGLSGDESDRSTKDTVDRNRKIKENGSESPATISALALAARRSKKCSCAPPFPSLDELNMRHGSNFRPLKELGKTFADIEQGTIVATLRNGRWVRARVNEVTADGLYLGVESSGGGYSGRIKDCTGCAHVNKIVAMERKLSLFR